MIKEGYINLRENEMNAIIAGEKWISQHPNWPARTDYIAHEMQGTLIGIGLGLKTPLAIGLKRALSLSFKY